MTTPIAEDFAHIAAELRRIEEEKAKMLATPLPEVQPDFTQAYAFLAQDYDPA